MGKGGETGDTAEPKTKDKQTDRVRTKGSQKQIQKCEQFALARVVEGGGGEWREKAGTARQLVTFGAWHFVKRETETRINANVI